MYKNIIRGIINKKTGYAATFSRGIVFTYHYKNNTRSQSGLIDFDCSTPSVRVSIKGYIQ